MATRFRFVLFFISSLILLGGCTLQEPEVLETTLSSNEKLLFSRLVGLGDNIMSGYQNAALTEKHQKYDFMALLARQGETPDFQQPYMGYPGIGSESYGGYGTLELKYVDNPETPQTVNPDPLIYAVPFSDYPDFDPNLPFVSDEVMSWAFPYNNLGIPGINLKDVLKGKTKLHSSSHSPMLDIILRNPLPDPYGELSPFEQAKLFVPSLVVCWAGMFDVLGYAQYSASGQTFSEPTSKEDFAKYYAELMDSVKSTQAAVIVANIPDILDMPYFNVVPGVVIDTVTNAPYLDENNNPVPLIGVNEGDKILMPAKFKMRKEGYGIPQGILNGNGQPLPDDMVLDATEIATVEQAIDDYNASIDSICLSRNIPVVDMYGFFKQINEGYEVAGMTFTSDFISGGFYSLDGVHPGDLGHALLANQWLDKINSSFRLSIPPVNIVQIMSELQPTPTDTLSKR